MIPGSRDGFALPVTIFLVALLTLMLATGFARVRADRQIGVSSEYTIEALTVAQSGLQTYLGTRTTRPPDGDSVRINVVGGYSWVVARLVQAAADTLEPQTYIVRSTGYVLEPTVSPDPMAMRTVARFALWQTGTMDALAALTALNDTERRGGGGPPSQFAGDRDTLSGIDACGEAPAIPSLWTPDYDDHTSTPVQPATFEPGPPVESAVTTDIDWSATVGSGIAPDYTSIQVDSEEWSVQRVTGDAVLTDGRGRGLLIVSGGLDFEGTSAAWEGVILVGQDADFNATVNRVEGLVLTGLAGGVSNRTQFGRANVQLVIRYNSCYVARALEPLTGFAEVPNAWIDNWATW